ncbi:MAG: type II toxin-antitoxin system PemK/MazF family toxin [Deltaproteobacteria bacterium]|nr:type II toxin-antitoxin system PemK/MazF family toxin [Deltaproteobacteria bacterium]
MTTFERGDVVLVPVPFSDLSAVKKRPAVVISSDEHNRQSVDLVITAITSRSFMPGRVGECVLEKWSEAGLAKPSVVKPAVSTIEQRLVTRKLGRLVPDDQRNLDAALRSLLQL